MPSSIQKHSTPPLSEFCEPFFLEVSEVLRSGYAGFSGEPWPVRDRLKKCLDHLQEDVNKKYPALEREYSRIEWVLAVFADGVIALSTLPFAKLWQGPVLLASEPRINIKNGMEKFFQELDATLREPPSDAAERLAIFEACLGLGFGGIHFNNLTQLRTYSEQILQRLNFPTRGRGADERICPEAYEYTQTDELFKPVTEKLLAIGIVCGALLLAVVVAYVCVYLDGRGKINDALGFLAQSR